MLILKCPPGPVRVLAFSPDGQTLASVSGRSHVIWLWDLNSHQPRGEIRGHVNRVVCLSFSPDGRFLGAGDSGGLLRLWNALTGASWGTPRKLEVVSVVGCRVCFAPGGLSLAANATYDPGSCQASLWQDLGTPFLSAVPALGIFSRGFAHTKTISALAFAPDGQTLATGSFDRTVKLWDVKTREHRFTMIQGKKVHFLAFAPDGLTLASASPQGLVKLWKAATGQHRSSLKGQAKELHALCYSPDSRTLATAAGDGTVRFWNVETVQPSGAFDWGIGAVHSVAFAPDGMRAAAGGAGQIMVWDIDEWAR